MNVSQPNTLGFGGPGKWIKSFLQSPDANPQMSNAPYTAGQKL
jgi:hypothetical protein